MHQFSATIQLSEDKSMSKVTGKECAACQRLLGKNVQLVLVAMHQSIVGKEVQLWERIN